MEEDRISRLPEDVLRRIVSFLPTESAVATSILARPWKNLYTSNPNLDFDDFKSAPKALFVEFVSKLLGSNTSPSIDSLQLTFEVNHSQSTINNWISAALSRNLRKLHMSFHMGGLFSFDLSQYCCSTLKTLQVLDFGGGEFPEIPESVVLPCLRVLFLRNVLIGGMSPGTGSALASYFRSCPLLEEFTMLACVLDGQVQVFNPLLRKVSIDYCSGTFDLVFNSPNLQYLEFYGENSNNCIVKNPLSLVTAGFTFPVIADCPSFISEMHNVCSLHLSMYTLSRLYSSNRPLAAFQNVTCLELDALDTWDSRCFFEHLLDTFARLEVLVFLKGFSTGCDENFELRSPKVKPACLSRTFRELGFGTFCARKSEIEIVKYFLANGDVLNEVMLGSGVYLLSPFRFSRMEWRPWLEDPKMYPLCVSRTSETLAGLPKASETCQIVLSWIKDGKLCRRNINEFPHCQATF